IVPATTFAAAPTRMASNKAIASLDRTSPTKIAESPKRRVDLMPIDGSTSEPGADNAEATFNGSILYPNLRIDSVGSSKVSSIVRIRARRMISVRKEPNNDVFPELRVPATRIAALLSIRKLIKPEARAFMYLIFGCMYKGKVQGKSRCRRKEKTKPVGLNGAVIAETLEVNPSTFSSVSKIGLASSKGRPEMRRNLVAQLSTSKIVGKILV